uniref:F-box domain-containing protein n=1 Tax=Quercus lobata TaxID=97700 RepID=A0A7N2RCA6_QUELO
MEKTLLLSSDKKCKRKVEGLDDLISRLPNEILIYILSFLSSKEACRTSVLSHTWKHLWPFFSGTLNFDDPSTRMDIAFRRKKSEFEMNRFVERVNSILKSHRASTLEGFRVKFELNNCYKHHIDKWIDFAISKRVKSLELDLSKCTFENVYEFPLERVKVSVGIKSLTSLTLERVHVTSELLENFLSSCPLLELLHVSSVRVLFNLKISGASLKLKFLQIHCPHCKIVEIVAPNLEYLGFDGIIDFHVDFAPRLLNVCIGGTSYGMRNAFRSLSSCLDRLEGLMVDFIMLGKVRTLNFFFLFSNLSPTSLLEKVNR